MDHNLYILGAGISKEAGLPLAKEILDMMLEARFWLSAHDRQEELNAVNRVLEFRRKASCVCEKFNFSPNNIEELLSFASTDASLTLDIRRALAAALNYAYLKHKPRLTRYRLQLGVENDANFTKTDLTLYGHFARLFSGALMDEQTENTIITFNYDTLIEDGFREASCRFNHGENDSNNSQTVIYKPHGSMNCSEINSYDSYDELCKAGEVPALVPPARGKTSISQKQRSIWGKAEKRLESVRRIIVLGFSFQQGDSDFRNHLMAGLMGNIELEQILIVDPNPEPVKENLNSIFSDRAKDLISYHCGTASSFLFNEELLRKIKRVDSSYRFSKLEPKFQLAAARNSAAVLPSFGPESY